MIDPSINWLTAPLEVTDTKAIEVLREMRQSTAWGSDAFEALTLGIVALTVDMRERGERVPA